MKRVGKYLLFCLTLGLLPLLSDATVSRGLYQGTLYYMEDSPLGDFFRRNREIRPYRLYDDSQRRDTVIVRGFDTHEHIDLYEIDEQGYVWLVGIITEVGLDYDPEDGTSRRTKLLSLTERYFPGQSRVPMEELQGRIVLSDRSWEDMPVVVPQDWEPDFVVIEMDAEKGRVRELRRIPEPEE